MIQKGSVVKPYCVNAHSSPGGKRWVVVHVTKCEYASARGPTGWHFFETFGEARMEAERIAENTGRRLRCCEVCNPNLVMLDVKTA